MLSIRKIVSTAVATLGVLGLFAGGEALAAAPQTPVTQAANSITGTTAVLNGKLNPGASASSGYDFTYNTNGTCTEGATTEPGGEATGQDIEVSTEIAGLEPSTEYTFCAISTHLEGEVLESTSGAPLEFETLAIKPSVDEESVSSIGASDAVLNAQVNPNNQEATYVFEYANDEALVGATMVVGASPLVKGFGDEPATVDIGGGLQPGTTYYYRVRATNGTGEAAGVVQSFTTLSAPVITTDRAQNLTRTGATLSGTVDSGGAETSYRFVYIDQVDYEAALAQSAVNPYANGRSTAEATVVGDRGTHVIGPLQVGELQPGVTYHYELIAANEVATVMGPDSIFITASPTPPIVLTGIAVNVGLTTATITGTVNTHGLQTTYGFQLAPAGSAFGPPMGLGGVGAGANEADASVTLNGLQANTTYHYRITATNIDGTTYGAELTFTTPEYLNPLLVSSALPLLSTPSIVFPSEAPTITKTVAKIKSKSKKKAKTKKTNIKNKHKKK